MYYGMEIFGYNGRTFFNNAAVSVMILLTFFTYKSKKSAMSLFSENVIYATSTVNKKLVPVARNLMFIVEMLLFSHIAWATTRLNGIFGSAFDTGANYFGLLAATPIFITIYSLVLFINPVKQIDIFTIIMPIFLIFVKIGCFLSGCCWGIPWEHGLYNASPFHPGNQVPVQLIEAILALLIFFFLLWYRKRAKPGTMYPMYMTMYSATRFFSEFTKADYPNVLGPLKMYHLLCLTGIIIGLLLMLVVKIYGDTIYNFFEKPHVNLKTKIAQREERLAIEAIENKKIADAAEKERLEKVRLAREKAKSRKKSK